MTINIGDILRRNNYKKVPNTLSYFMIVENIRSDIIKCRRSWVEDLEHEVIWWNPRDIFIYFEKVG